jgi:2-oxoglutarate/2-oxoacid ferredoxin oxidoreductase subunit beta
MKKVIGRPKLLKDVPFHYCPGCGHSVIHRLLAEVIEELDIRDRCIGVPPCGCAVLAYFYLDVDMVEAAHGRATAVATGIKRCLPEAIVFTYQGDGDLAAIGTSEVIHSANRGECITSIFVNNMCYGMTGGQMAPTSILGQKTTTTPRGREKKNDGPPMKMCEFLSSLEGAAYLARDSVHHAKAILKTKRHIREAFQTQIDQKGFSMVEILSPCPSNWKLTPVESNRWIEKEMIHHFPLGVFRGEREKRKQETNA